MNKAGKTRGVLGPLIAVLVCTAGAGNSHASSSGSSVNPVLDDQFLFRLGGLRNELQGEVTVLRQPLPETPIDVDDLGLDDSQNSLWGGIHWRFGERWALNFQYDRMQVEGSTRVDSEFNFDGEIFEVGAGLESEFTADAYILDVTYAIFKSSHYEAGLGLGLHAFDLELTLDSTLQAGEEEASFTNADESLLAPVPNFRLFGTYAFNETTSVSLTGGWLGATYEDWDGRFLYARAFVEWRPSQHWGLGLGYQFTDIELEHDDDGDFEEYQFDLQGILAYVSYSF